MRATTDDPAPDTPEPVPEPPKPHPHPITGAERIEALDVLRGVAVLGILLMNVQSFGSLNSAYMNPALKGVPGGSELWLWITTHVLADTKFITLFSFMFGVGIAVFADRLAARGRKPAGLHYRRMGWLWLIGMLHGYLLWYGDILVSYAVCGAVVYLLRRLRPRWLLLIGSVMIVVPSLGMAGFAAAVPHLPPEALEGMAEGWTPGESAIADEIAAMRGGWLDQMPHRALHTLMMQTVVHLFFVAWRSGGLMLIGMAALKTDVITAARSRRFYVTMLVVGLVVGLPLIAVGIVQNYQHGWEAPYSMLTGMQFNYWGSLGVAAAYLAIVMLMVRSRALPALRARLTAVGRLAFSNYLGQTLICTTIFYGHGLGLFARTERWHDLLIVLAVWAVQLVVSPWWLARFRFGPMEWAWRSLTYWERQPLRRVAG
ncbi:DUF418 domain-containing protein [bacterium]|nr:DUF418 domain-containing protein [bacterium]